jgi:hypothetical protein
VKAAEAHDLKDDELIAKLIDAKQEKDRGCQARCRKASDGRARAWN